MRGSFLGLNAAAVLASRARHGDNALPSPKGEGFWRLFFGKLADPLILILLAALVVTLVLAAFGYSHWFEGLGIGTAVLLAAMVAAVSEHRSEREFLALLEEATRILVKVYREGQLQTCWVGEVVVGDLVLLQAGDQVPADGVLLFGQVLVNEAALTGESEPHWCAAPDAVDNTIIQRLADGDPPPPSLIRRGALVEDGEGGLRVEAVGSATEYGRMFSVLHDRAPRPTPLQVKLSALGAVLARYAYVGAMLIGGTYLAMQVFSYPGGVAAYWALPAGRMMGDWATALVLSITLIVMAVPEGLPLTVAVVLARNMRRLLHAQVLVRSLLGIETAGSLTLLFTDKTGTLTEGRLTAEALILGDGSYHPGLAALGGRAEERLALAIRSNTAAEVDCSTTPPRIVGGDRTELALLRLLGGRLGTETPPIKLGTHVLFNSSRKYSAVEVWAEDGSCTVFVKGAPEVLLAHTAHYLDRQGVSRPFPPGGPLADAMRDQARRSMRLLAVAEGVGPLPADGSLPTGLLLLAVVGLRDGLRTDSHLALERARRAGVQVVMVTGDAEETASAIAREVGLLARPEAEVLTSSAMAALSDAELTALLPKLAVVARAFPSDKGRLVRLAKEAGAVVGMTGDGVNDAEALALSDVGFAMGSGTEIAKEAAQLVIQDDRFYSITEAILYGRSILKAIRCFLVFQLTVSLSAVALAFLGPFLQVDLPLTVVQLLWVNLISDTLAGIAFSGEPPREEYMASSPVPRGLPIVTKEMLAQIGLTAVTVVALSVFFLVSDPWYRLFCPGGEVPPARAENLSFLTAFFVFFSAAHAFNMLNVRTEGLRLWAGIHANRSFLAILLTIMALVALMVFVGGQALRVVPLSGPEWGYVLGLAFLVVPLDLIRKFLCAPRR
jgi:calcium-translocating P-type ATPase